MKFFIKDLVTSTEEIINEKLHFFCSDLEEASKRRTMKVKVQLFLYKKSLLNKVLRVVQVPKCPSAWVPKCPSSARVSQVLQWPRAQVSLVFECSSDLQVPECFSAWLFNCHECPTALGVLFECPSVLECSSNKKGLQQYTGNGLLNFFI